MAKRLPTWMLAVALFALLFCVSAGFAQASSPDAIKQYKFDYIPGTGGTGPKGVTDLTMGNFSCGADGSASGSLFVNPQCEASGALGVFSNVICRVENLFGQILGLMYCSVQAAIVKPLLALLTLYVVIYGAMVMLGMVQQTFSEALVRIFKIGLVSAIALNAEIAIGVAYKFYISMTQTTVAVVFQAFTPEVVAQNPTMQQMMEGGYIARPDQLQGAEHWVESIDATFHKIIGFFVQGGVGFAIVMAALFIFAPPLFFLIVYLIVSLFKAFAQGVVGYLLALLGITFLFAVSPIFVCFALFRVTSGWLDAWLRYLASFTLQLMIVFSFLMFMVMIDIVSFFQNIGGLIRKYEYIYSFGFIHIPFNVYSLCRVKRDGPNEMTGNIIYYKVNLASGGPGAVAASRYEGFPQCIENYTREGVLVNGKMPVGLDQNQVNEIVRAMNMVRAGQLNVPTTGDLPSGLQTIQGIIDKANADLTMLLSEVLVTPDVVSFLLVRFLAIIILTSLLGSFMDKIPHFAGYLAGTGFAGRLGGGEVSRRDAPGLQDNRDFGGVETGSARFKEAAGSGGGVFSAPARLVRGVAAGLGGIGSGMLNNAMNNTSNLGMTNRVLRELGASENLELLRAGELQRGQGGGMGRPGGYGRRGPGGRRPGGRSVRRGGV